MLLPEKITLETNRLILRTPQLDDTTAMMAILNDVETMQHLGYMTTKNDGWTSDKTLARIENQINLQKEDKAAFLHIYNKKTTLLMGTTGFTQLDLQDKIGVSGIILYRPYWRQGFATEVYSALLQYGFESLNLKKINFYTMSSNEGMRRFFDKLGIGFECRNNGEIKKLDYSTHGELVYSLTDDQWHLIRNIKSFQMSKFIGKQS